jgi:hypothetical protein
LTKVVLMMRKMEKGRALVFIISIKQYTVLLQG